MNKNLKIINELSQETITKRENIIRNYHPWKAIFFIC